jgi:hypothetical protein
VIWGYYTGSMVGYRLIARPDGQIIELRIEGYLSILTPASNRSLMSQSIYDALDTSAEVALASANGANFGSGQIAAASMGGSGRSEGLAGKLL